MIAEIIDYKNIVEDIANLVKNSPFKMEYIVKTVGMPPATFYRKMNNSSFTADEMLAIAKIISPQETYLYELKQAIKQSNDDIKEGRIFEHQEVIDEIRREFLQ